MEWRFEWRYCNPPLVVQTRNYAKTKIYKLKTKMKSKREIHWVTSRSAVRTSVTDRDKVAVAWQMAATCSQSAVTDVAAPTALCHDDSSRQPV